MKTKLIEVFVPILIAIACCAIVGAITLGVMNSNTKTAIATPIIEEPKITITWLGYPIHAIPNPTPNPDQPLVLQVEPGIQIGLRSDGIIVWRLLKREPKQTEEELEGE